MRTADFVYELPDDRIAQSPIEPRDAARLLDARDATDHTFRELPELLEAGDLVVVNRTRVRRARLIGSRANTGGRVELLLLEGAGARWTALSKASRRLRVGDEIRFHQLRAVVVASGDDGAVEVELYAEADGDVSDRIEQAGQIPLPPYFLGEAEDDRYQTMFAKTLGSAAAPTAGLHFTPTVVEGLMDRDIELAEVDLAVGVDTFRPIKEELVEAHRIHAEAFTVPTEAVDSVARCRERSGRLVAVGTTVVRALESAAAADGRVREASGKTDLFIRPGHQFRVVDLLVTNFHVPASTLVVMIAAFMGSGWRRAYQAALDRKYRFLSFGDAMLAARQ